MTTENLTLEIETLESRRNQLLKEDAKSPRSKLTQVENDIQSKRAELVAREATERRADLMGQLAHCASDAHAAALSLEETRVALDEVLQMYAARLLTSEQAAIAARQTFIATFAQLVPHFRRWERLTPTEAVELEQAVAGILEELRMRDVDIRAVCYSGWTGGSYPCDIQTSPLSPLVNLRFGELIKLASRVRLPEAMPDDDDSPKAA